jgi:CubicO group peptidase (beta-lactamase class C family)
MRFIIALLMLCPFLVASSSSASEQPPAVIHSPTIDLLLDQAIAKNQIAGGVVVVGNRDGILSTSARGRLNSDPGAPALDERTMFDLASLTKVVATAPAVMKLLDEGKISLSDPLSRYFPEFNDGREQITVLNLLTHTSGLDDVSVSSQQSMESAIRKAAAERRSMRPGAHFHYADINFILLGELVHRVSGETLDAFCKEEIFGPLGDEETMFLPPQALVPEIAPTSGSVGGVVQDGNARRLGGVAGHAGVFSSAYDLSRYARMILGGGAIDGRRVLSGQVVAEMTTPYLCNNGQVKRCLGWDMASPFSAPRGSFFSASSFGHTGYSGSSIWIDPQQDLFVIMLTRRLNYRNTRSFNQLRRDVSTMAVADFKTPGTGTGELAQSDRAKITAEVVQANFVPEAPVRFSNVAVEYHPRAHHHQRAQRHVARTARLARTGGRALYRVPKVARADTGRPGHHRKRRTLART